MKLNSSQLEAFFVVARLLNFTKAAEHLHVTQSALSQRIAKLEEHLETALFIRDRSSIRLTEAGQQVLRFCQYNEIAESEMLSKLTSSNSELAGALRIGGFSSINRSMILPAIKNLMAENPKLSVHFLTRELRDLDQLLRSTEVDYIFTNKKAETPDIENIFLGFEENVLVQSKKYRGPDIYLDHDENLATTTGYFSQNKLSFKPAGLRYMDDVYGLIDGVKNGYGKAIVPLHLIENEKDLEIINRKQILKVSVYLKYYVQPYYRQTHKVFLNEVTRYFKNHLVQK